MWSLWPEAAGLAPTPGGCSFEVDGSFGEDGAGCPGSSTDFFGAEDDEEDCTLTDEQYESLGLATRQGEMTLKVGLSVVESCENSENAVVVEQLKGLRVKLRILNKKLTTAKTIYNFKTLEEAWLQSFDNELDELSQSSHQAELHSKMVKGLLSSLKTPAKQGKGRRG